MKAEKTHAPGGLPSHDKEEWGKAVRRVGNFGDKLGRRIDSKIRSSVIALQAFGFQTTASCQGHLNWGESYPWIEIGITPAKFPTIALRRQGSSAAARRTNLRAQQLMLRLLDSYYRNRVVPSIIRLILVPRGIYGGFELRAQGSEIQLLLRKKVRKKELLHFQKEFEGFARFLKDMI